LRRSIACAVDSSGQALTTNQGVPVADNQNSLKAGLRGPTLLEDFIPSRKDHALRSRTHSRAYRSRARLGAHGFFECNKAMKSLTRASIFAEAGKRTPVFVRFSTVAGERGSTDTARDVRGFAVKFYTDEGNWDLVGNNIPVFFIQDAMKFPDLVHAVKPEPHHGMPQAASAHDTFWDFVSLMPESTHMLMWVMSDRGIRAAFAPCRASACTPTGWSTPQARLCSSSSTGCRSKARIRWCGTRPSRSPAPIRTFIAAICGKRSKPAPIRNGS
jgi:catalase